MTTLVQKVLAWFEEPQDIMGLALWATTTANAVAQALAPTHAVSIPEVVAGAVGGLVAVIFPTAGKAVAADSGKVAGDIATAAEAKSAATAPTVIADAAKIIEDIEAAKAAPVAATK